MPPRPPFYGKQSTLVPALIRKEIIYKDTINITDCIEISTSSGLCYTHFPLNSSEISKRKIHKRVVELEKTV